MSDDDSDGDMVTMQVCAANGCGETSELTFDEDFGEHYCRACLEKVQTVEETGDYDIFLNADDSQVVQLIFRAFDKKRTGRWTFEQFNAFAAATSAGRTSVPQFTSQKEFHTYVLEEYGVACGMYPSAVDPAMLAPDFTPLELRKIYGGYWYNDIDALREDFEQLEEAGIVHSSVLE